jgi:acetyl esterase/lipase
MRIPKGAATPAYDRELRPALATLSEFLVDGLKPETISSFRSEAASPSITDLLTARSIVQVDYEVPRPDGTSMLLSVFRKSTHAPGGPGIYCIHGGGMVVGDRYSDIAVILDWVDEFDAVGLSVEYRLAPEHPHPAPADDCYTALLWAVAHADEVGFDPSLLVVGGVSAGGGLAASTVLRARDTGGPAIAGQILMCPMLDDRNQTPSSFEFAWSGTWLRQSNVTGWTALLGSEIGAETVSVYAAPGRETDYTGLPPTFIDVGSTELFRDENIAFANAVWAAGGDCELHVWAGAYHGSFAMVPEARVSIATAGARRNWLARVLRCEPTGR